jgi:BASS family bile acid:Na+ symporter
LDFFERLLAYEYYFASAQLALAMIGMGATLHPRDFVTILRVPKSFLVGYFCVLVLSPLVAVLISKLFVLEAGIATGIVLIAAVPGGTMSNLLTFFARANVALSIALTACATLTCLISTPIILNFFAADLLPSAVVMPARAIAADIFMALLLPLCAGMALGANFEAYRPKITKYCIQASLAAILILVVVSSGSGRIHPNDYGLVTPVAMVTFGLLLLMIPAVIATAMRIPREDAVTIAIETCFRNCNLALLIKATVFPAVPGVADPFADQVLFVALVYGMVGTVISVPVTIWNRRAVAA